MPLREIYAVNLPGQTEEEMKTSSSPEGIISACSWSDEGLLAISSAAGKSKDYFRKILSYTASPAIYVFHVDRPEAHSLLAGGHDYEIFSLSWAPRHLGICLLSADIRAAVCIWRPIQGLVNRWQLHHRLLLSSPKLVMWMNPSPIYSMPANSQVSGKPGFYDSKYRKDPPSARPDYASLPATASPFSRISGEHVPAGPRCPQGHMCIAGVTRYGEARVFLETAAGAAQSEWSSAAVRLCTHEVADPGKARVAVSEGTLYVQAATAVLRDGAMMLAVSDENQARHAQRACPRGGAASRRRFAGRTHALFLIRNHASARAHTPTSRSRTLHLRQRALSRAAAALCVASWMRAGSRDRLA